MCLTKSFLAWAHVALLYLVLLLLLHLPVLVGEPNHLCESRMYATATKQHYSTCIMTNLLYLLKVFKSLSRLLKFFESPSRLLKVWICSGSFALLQYSAATWRRTGDEVCESVLCRIMAFCTGILDGMVEACKNFTVIKSPFTIVVIIINYYMYVLHYGWKLLISNTDQ